MLAAGGTVYFSANDGLHGDELWKSDGTAAGTLLVKDIRTGPEGSLLVPHAAAGGTVILEADDGVHGLEPWLTDGTAAGTRLLADINPGGAGSIDSAVRRPKVWLATSDGRFFFQANDGVHGYELWESDGMEAGTRLVRDLQPGSTSGIPFRLTELAGTVYFTTIVSPLGIELWKTDGTPAGTSIVKDICPGSVGSAPTELTVFAGRLFFQADDGVHGRELWASDGTAAGTVLVKDVGIEGHGTPRGLAVVAGRLLFFATQDFFSGLELWSSDGTEAGTMKVTGFGNKATPNVLDFDVLAVESRLYFRTFDLAGEFDLWTSDGTADGTVMVRNGTPLTSSIDISPWDGRVLIPSSWGALGERLIYRADDGTTGYEPWSSDGTPAGTLSLQTNPGPNWHTHFGLTPLGGSALFAAGAIWKTDGTPSGTRFLDIEPIAPAGFELWSTTVTPIPLDFYPVALCRLVDTRPSSPLLTDQKRTFPVAGTCGIPAEARAVAVTFAAISANGSGNLAVWRKGAPKPGTSVLNYAPGATRSNNGIVELGNGGEIDVQGQTFVENGQVHFILDVTGYFR